MTKNVLTMNGKELIAKVAEKTGETKVKLASILKAVDETVVEALKQVDPENVVNVKLLPGVTLIGEHQDACMRRNPQNGDMTKVEAKTKVRCKISSPIKAAVNDPE